MHLVHVSCIKYYFASRHLQYYLLYIYYDVCSKDLEGSLLEEAPVAYCGRVERVRPSP